MANNNTQIAVKDQDIPVRVGEWAREYLRPFYRGKDFDGWKADAVLAITQNNALRACLTNELEAALLMRALQLNAASGLSLSPQRGEAALVVYRGNKGAVVTHMPMKNGLVKTALRTGKVARIESGTVYEHDDFKPKKSSAGDGYDWEIAVDDRGPPKGYFALVKLTDGTSVLEYQTKEQVWEHAIKYGNGRVWDDQARRYKNEFYAESAWGKSFDGMAEKTVIRAVLGGLYLPEIEELFQGEEEPPMRDVTEPQRRGASAEDIEEKLAEQAAREEARAEPAAAAESGKPAAKGPNGEQDIF
jgi:phage RecT family recombinase